MPIHSLSSAIMLNLFSALFLVRLPSNLDAFAKMDWDSDDFEILTAQMAEISKHPRFE